MTYLPTPSFSKLIYNENHSEPSAVHGSRHATYDKEKWKISHDTTANRYYYIKIYFLRAENLQH
jgi:hypothetical protein